MLPRIMWEMHANLKRKWEAFRESLKCVNNLTIDSFYFVCRVHKIVKIKNLTIKKCKSICFTFINLKKIQKFKLK